MRALALALTSLSMLLGCRPAPPETRVRVTDDVTVTQPPATPTRFRYAWQPGRFEVVEHVHKKGQAAKTAYTLVVEPHGDELWILYSNFHFLEIAGRDAQDPALRTQVEPIEREMAKSLFGLRINAAGDYVGVTGFDEILAMVRAIEGEEKAVEYERIFSKPKVRALMEQIAGKPWGVWVGAWRDLEFAPGEVLEGSVEHQVETVRLTEFVRYEHLGEPPEQPGYVRVRAEGRLEDPAVALLLGNIFDEMVPEATGGDLDGFLRDMTMRRETTYEAVLEPSTLQPAWVLSTETIVVEGKGERREKIESHEWTFTRVGE